MGSLKSRGMMHMNTGLLTIVALASVGSAIVGVFVAITVGKVHVLVNSRMTAVLERVDQLTEALERSGIDVPPDPNPTN